MTSNKVADPKPFDREALRDKTKGIVPKNGQLSLPLFHSEIHIENQGIEMGILESGIPYLSQRGLVKMAGIGRTSFQRLSSNWHQEKNTSEVGIGINKILKQYAAINKKGQSQVFFSFEEALSFLSKSI